MPPRPLPLTGTNPFGASTYNLTATADSPPNEVVRLEVSLDIKEDCDGKEAIQA
jgi:hypothetical protein